MTLKEKSKQDNQIMHVLKVTELSHILGQTNNGVLTLKLTKGGTEKDYVFHLDAVPYPNETNAKLLELFDGVLWEKEEGIQFYEDKRFPKAVSEELAALVDDSTTEVTIETPEGWQCEKPGCDAEYKHEHSTYESLK